MNYKNITRVEIIDEKGRSYLNWNKDNVVELSFQDNNRTLKIFISKKRNETELIYDFPVIYNK